MGKVELQAKGFSQKARCFFCLKQTGKIFICPNIHPADAGWSFSWIFCARWEL